MGIEWTPGGMETRMPLSLLSVKDVEEIYVTGFLVAGFLLFGASGFLVCCKFNELSVTT